VITGFKKEEKLMEDLKLGMVGLDTSHCGAFAELLHNKEGEHHVRGGRIIKAFPGGSSDFSNSISRVEGFTSKLKDDYGVEIADSVEGAAEGADAVFLESVDGRQHLEQFRKLAPFGKPVFIDKPLACSASDAQAIFELSKEYGAPVFSCSAIRYAKGVAELGEGKEVSGCQAFGPAAILPDYPGYFWYGVHSVEVLFSKMGAGCAEVSVKKGGAADAITGLWEDGRLGTVYGYRIEKLGTFGCTVFGEGLLDTGAAQGSPPYYALMLPEIMEFFRTGEPPVAEREMLEVAAFLEAAGRSRDSGEAVRIEV
jgi:hypothetical protein